MVRSRMMLSSTRTRSLAESRHYLVHCVVNELLAQLRQHIGLGVFEGRLHRSRDGSFAPGHLLPKELAAVVRLPLLTDDVASTEISDQEAEKIGLSGMLP